MSGKLLLPLLAVLLIVLSACGKAQANTSPTPELATPTLAAKQDILDLGSEALAKKQSFRMRLTFNYDGIDTEGEPQKGEVYLVNEYWLNAAKDRHLSLSEHDLLTDDALGTGMLQLGGQNYIYTRDDTRGLDCGQMRTDTPSGPDGLEQMKAGFQPNMFIGGIKGARMVERSVSVNGVMTDHYIFEQVDFGKFTSVKGDVWLAQGKDESEEFIVHYTGEATGESDPMGLHLSGTIIWDYQIEDINQVPETQLFAECTTVQMGIPLPEQIDLQQNHPRSLIFGSPAPVAELAAFFRDRLPAQGWALEASEPMGEMWSLDFRQGGALLQVRIEKKREGSSVTIDRVEEPDPASVDDLPLPDSATEHTSLNGLLQFYSAEPPATLADFYVQRLPADGWEQKTDQSGWAMYTLGFTRGLHWVWLDILPDGNGRTMVTIHDDTAD